VEQAGVLRPAEREWPRMDPPNVLWFGGTYAAALASYALISTIPTSHNSAWVFLAAVVLLLAYALASWILLRRGWWVPGGLAAGLLVIVGVFLDAFGRRRNAFWFHVLGWFSAAAGLVFFTIEPGGDPNRGWIPMLIVGTLMVIAAAPIRRATWAVYGVLGYYA